MKTIYHVPTEQFGFIEIEMEEGVDIPQISINARIEQYRAISEAVKVPAGTPIGLTDKELDLIVENMCLQKTTVNGVELWAKATDVQRKEINRLKRALSRIKRKHTEDYAEESLSDIG